MAIHPLAGKPAPAEILIDVAALEKAYYERKPNVDDPAQLVSFGTSGHRGSPLSASLNEAHILAITQAICEYRASKQITGPLFMGKDTHAASGPAQRTALEVLAAKCCRHDHSARRRLHADAGDLAGDPGAQPRQERPARRRHRRHAVA